MTIRLQKPQLSPTDDHGTWQDSWNDSERLLAHAAGYLDSLVTIALVKRELQDETMPPNLRLRFLVVLNKLVRDRLTLAAMQCVQPACDTAMAMLAEMKGLNVEDQAKLMSTWNVCASFANLNPSIIEAIKLFNFPGERRSA